MSDMDKVLIPTDNCIFCQIVKKDIPAKIVYEDEDILAFLDIEPNNPGHTLVIPKKHHQDLFDLPEDILSKLLPAIQKIAEGVRVAVSAPGINIRMNNGSEAGQIIYHAHIHIIPRFKDDGLQPWGHKKVIEAEMESLHKKIKDAIESKRAD